MLTYQNAQEKYLEAIKIACTHHSLQKYGKDYYFKHLQATENILIELGYAKYEGIFTATFEEEIISAYRYKIDAWLHDLLEDGCLSYNDIKKRFGIDIAEDCFAMEEEKGRNRKERKPDSYYINIGKNIYAGRVKIADRTANIEESTDMEMAKMYWKENEQFKLIYQQNPTAFHKSWTRLLLAFDKKLVQPVIKEIENECKYKQN